MLTLITFAVADGWIEIGLSLRLALELAYRAQDAHFSPELWPQRSSALWPILVLSFGKRERSVGDWSKRSLQQDHRTNTDRGSTHA
jgi:hypothetical protein